jgi:hypothetical protein
MTQKNGPDLPDWAHAKRELPDGRTLFVIVRGFNTILTLGYGLFGYDDSW